MAQVVQSSLQEYWSTAHDVWHPALAHMWGDHPQTGPCACGLIPGTTPLFSLFLSFHYYHFTTHILIVVQYIQYNHLWPYCHLFTVLMWDVLSDQPLLLKALNVIAQYSTDQQWCLLWMAGSIERDKSAIGAGGGETRALTANILNICMSFPWWSLAMSRTLTCLSTLSPTNFTNAPSFNHLSSTLVWPLLIIFTRFSIAL